MKKKISKSMRNIGILIFIIIVIATIVNIHKWIVSGNQQINIVTPNIAYTNNDLYVSISATRDTGDKSEEVDTKSKIKLLNSKGKKVKNVSIKYDGDNAILSLPDLEEGKYYLELKVSSDAGKDTVKREIYISKGDQENVTTTLDKGIYKPGDTVNFRSLLTKKDNDEPISQDVNVSIYDGNNNKVYNEDVKSSDYGIISGKFNLANEVNSGVYKLVVKTSTNETTKEFKVNPYVTPKYEVKMNFDKENYIVGDTAKITFNSKYFFGEAVQNADLTVYINGEKNTTLKTDTNGNATLDYLIKDAKVYSVKVEAVDSSNYYVEATGSFKAGTDLFEIELLPEDGKLIYGKANNVYVLTKKIDGTPVKTYVTVSSNNYTKQIATDDNGVGKFSIDIDQKVTSNKKSTNYYYDDYYNDLDNYYSSEDSRKFSIVAEDMNKNTVRKVINIGIEQKDLLISTDKVKYNQGDDIKVDISLSSENKKNIYFYKGDKLIKMVTTDSDESTVNLDDNYGLIDIYVDYVKNGVSYSKNDNSTYKKTIFIKPKKKLNINVNTDKQEYLPGDKINISFNISDENNSGVDAALLVSMLDNSVLNLADNDLSIDNIKLALSDIEFSDDLDAATLYSCIVDDSSEQTMMALLLKQNSGNAKISETSYSGIDEKDHAKLISCILIITIAIIIIICLLKRHKMFRKFMVHAANFAVLEFNIFRTMYIIADNITYDDFPIIGFIVVSLIALSMYIAFISKIHKKIFRTTISIIIIMLVCCIVGFLVEYLDFSFAIIALIFAILLLVWIILAKVSYSKKLKIDKFMRKSMKELAYMLKFLGAFAISACLFGFLNFLGFGTDADSEFLAFFGCIALPASNLLLYYLNYLFNNLGSKDKKHNNDKHEIENKEDIENSGVFMLFAGIGTIAIIMVIILVIYSFNQFDQPDVIYGDSLNEDISPSGSSGNGGFSPGDFQTDAADGDSALKSGSMFDGVGELFSSNDNKTNSTQNSTNSSENQNIVETKTEAVKDTKVRNVFLESMCFVPELVTENGKANLDLDLSDNITTWTIQTVGNTKDGRVGYGSLNNVKVFKDFFVDFELPKNLVETDNVSIPVTIYNYTENAITANIKIDESDWFKLDNNNLSISVNAKSNNMVYIPITILKSGTNKFKAEITGNGLTDIVEKDCTVSPKGYKVEKVVSTGKMDKDISEDILVLDDAIANTAKAKIKIYPSMISQTVEGMENIFKMPTGCFEQVSSSLYPNILALKYLEDNKIVDENIKSKALSYISSGYQKILTYEVKGETGGYSLYGNSPAETVLTAYGLMEVKDLSEVYSVDDKVINNMTEFLYKKQNSNGTFKITGSHKGGASSYDTLSLNAYIIWALSESNPNDSRLNKSVEYLKDKLDSIDDNYTLALVANTLENVKDKDSKNVLKILVKNVNVDGNNAYLTSKVTDYYGARYDTQTIQTVALTSMALSKEGYSLDTNKKLINYLISKKDVNGSWYNTQATILALKALNEANEKSKLDNQTISVKVNSDEQKVEIKDNPLDVYELTFENLGKENKLNINMEKGDLYYEVVEEYYIPYEKVDNKDDKIEVSVQNNSNSLKVNDILESNIKVINRSTDAISNGMVTISIPQGFTVDENSLELLKSKGIIEKYEMSYTSINIYLRNFDVSQIVNLDVKFRANYPVNITGLDVRAYDYYNPTIQGKSMPIAISVK